MSAVKRGYPGLESSTKYVISVLIYLSRGIVTFPSPHFVCDAGFKVLPKWKTRSMGLHILTALFE